MRFRGTLFLVVVLGLAVGCKHNDPASTSGTAGSSGGGGSTGGAKGHVQKLGITDVKVGTGNEFTNSDKPVELGDQVYVRYTGKLLNGTVFDSNQGNGKPPYEFIVGIGAVIKGWDQGLQGMRIGGIRKLEVPSDLAYGDRGNDTIPANSDLFFEVTLLDVLRHGEEAIIDYKDTKKGDGPEVKKGSTVTIKFSISDIDNEKLQSYDKPTTFKLDETKTYPGLVYGMLGMKAGGVREIHLPPKFMIPGKMAQPNMIEVVHVELQSVK
jgi:FKBP-type peptidyl-prolyl cis-trans isomerase